MSGRDIFRGNLAIRRLSANSDWRGISATLNLSSFGRRILYQSVMALYAVNFAARAAGYARSRDQKTSKWEALVRSQTKRLDSGTPGPMSRSYGEPFANRG